MKPILNILLALCLINQAVGMTTYLQKILKAASHVLLKPITIILNHSLRTGIFPDKLKIAKVIPLHKKII